MKYVFRGTKTEINKSARRGAQSNAMDAGTIYPSEAPEITSILSGVCVVRSVVSR
jgi:hypothetical protein